MPIIKIQGLKGLPGLNRLSDYERKVFYNTHKDFLNERNFKRQQDFDKAAEIIFNNQQFINKYGKKAFDQYNNGTEEAYNLRNNLLKNSIIEEEWNKYLSPFNADGTRDINKGLGNQWETYNEMSPDAKLKLMESDWLSPKEFNDQWKKEGDEYEKAYHNTNPLYNIGGLNQAMGRAIDEEVNHGEAAKQFRTEKNNRILERIYNDDLETRANALGTEVNSAYLSPDIANLSDDGVKKAFYNNFVSDNSDMVKSGKGEFASHWGSSELENLSIDDMRQWLAKKQVYMQNMSPNAATTALNNEAKKYIKDHQGTLKRMRLFARDVGISALSYTADKANGIYNLGLMIADGVSEKPTVYKDDRGEIIDPKKTSLDLGSNGTYNYKDAQGKQHTVRQVQIDRTTLHNMGKNFDGSEDESILNPQYWSRAERFGTLDSGKQKKYEKLGSSPYKVAYNPNEDSDLWYESFKMAAFGLADAASQLIPFGVGAAGRALSTASKVGRIGRRLGKVINFGGKALTSQTKFGQIAHGTAGALGIAYAYNRGVFQETLAQNLANAEETLNNKARNEIYNEYNSNKSYKRAVDMQIDKEAAKLKQQYLAQFQKDNGMQPADMKAVDKFVRSQAQQNVLQRMVDNRVSELKGSKDYADLQQEAINSAGDAAIATFLPEAVKYGFVNTIGFRKYLYTNPAGVTRKVSNTLKGLKEITTEGGKQRLTTEASKFLTKGQKWKQLGKTALSQAWGGAWTNGTDDMMTDAAERINSDSFDRYLNGFYNGEAVADTYGFADGLYSYLKGFSNSLGQETTMNATLVGALGSLVSASPNMTNIAHLVTKSGRENYRNNFWRETQKNDDGAPKTKKPSKLRDLPAQLNYFIQNGVLNTYYGKKQAEKDLQSHADYVNNILDEFNDFEDIERLVIADRALNDANGYGDQKTAKFIKAIHSINALNNLANNSSDPAVMSSVVQNAKQQMQSLAEVQFNPETDALPQDEQTQNLLSQYYANNPSVAQNDYTARQGLATMMNNAKELTEATEAYNNAEKEVSKAERNYGQPFAIPVREKLKLNQALDGHWRKRLDSMRQEIGDVSTDGEIADENVLPSLGGKKNAQSLVKAYNRQEQELQKEQENQRKETGTAQKKLKDTQKQLDENTDESKTYELQKQVSDAQAKLDDAKLQEGYIDSQLTSTRQKRQRVIDAITASEQEGAATKQLLTADEIFALDPKTRARMMRKENRDLYSDGQKSEIEKLERRLAMQDADALQKIQDISTLSQRIESNSDAYNKIMENPEAAAVRFESQRSAATMAAYNFINQRNAQSVVDFINEYNDAMKAHPDIDKGTKDKFVYRTLRRFNTNLLDIIDADQLLPQYQQQVNQAKNWSSVTENLDAVISSQTDKDQAWRDNVRQNIDGIIETANNRDEIISNLEKAIDDVDNPQAKQDIDLILRGMENLGYHRDATILENRAKRKEREEKAKAEAAEREAKDKALKDKVAKAADEEKAVKETEAAKNAAEKEAEENVYTENPIAPTGEEIVPTAEDDESRHAEDAEKVGDGEVADLGIVSTQSTNSNDNTDNQNSNDSSKNITDDGETVGSRNETLEEQIKDTERESGRQYSLVDNVDSEKVNDTTETTMESDDTTLTGNAMSEYVTFDKVHPDNPSLKKDGTIVHKKGEKENDPMNRYFAWMKNAGIHLQEIIDTELHQILEKNPHTKIKFMYVNPSGKGTDDSAMQNHLLLVVDYDDSINKGITGIHKDNNGGVITTNGKKYLIVGVAGYGSQGNTAKRDMYDILMSNSPKTKYGYGIIRIESNKYFKEHPEERYYVNETLSTEVVPRSLIPGYIVRQLEKDDHAEYRDISEILSDKDRNPDGLTLKDLVFGIQENMQFMVVFPEWIQQREVLGPIDASANMGRVFALIPASNGALVPSYIKPLYYADVEGDGSVMREGKLKDKVRENLNLLTSQNKDTRIDGIKGLSKIFCFDNKNGNGILTTKTKSIVSLLHNGKVFKSFNLTDPDFNRQDLFDAFEIMNPRVNITKQVLTNSELRAEYDEAGALQTDAALLHTVGASYSIYAVDANGNMIGQSKAQENTVQIASANGDFRKDSRQVVFKHNLYTYTDGKYYLNGKEVTDTNDIRQLDYDRRIYVENELVPSVSEGVWNTFILSKGEHPEVVKVSKNTYEVKEVPENEAKALIEKLDKKNNDKERRNAAESALKTGEAENVDLRLNDNSVTDAVSNGLGEVTEDTGEIVVDEGLQKEKHEKQISEVKEKGPEEQVPANPTNITYKATSATQSFKELYQNLKYKGRIRKVLMTKWKEAPKDIKGLVEYLKTKNVEVDAVGTSDEDVAAWVKTIEDCK